jgi:hypothetical protein
MKNNLVLGPACWAIGSRAKERPEERRRSGERISAPENLSQNRRKNRGTLRIPQEKMERAKGFET